VAGKAKLAAATEESLKSFSLSDPVQAAAALQDPINQATKKLHDRGITVVFAAGNSGPNADTMARRMLAQVNAEAWERTGAIAWSFKGKHQHVWDRARELRMAGQATLIF